MPNGHDTKKEYGGHDYPSLGGTSDCKYDCGCWMGPSNSGGPAGIDPFGTCPKNPKDGKLLGSNSDQSLVIEQRIRDLTVRADQAEAALKLVSPGTKRLGEKLATTRRKLAQKEQTLAGIQQLIKKSKAR